MTLYAKGIGALTLVGLLGSLCLAGCARAAPTPTIELTGAQVKIIGPTYMYRGRPRYRDMPFKVVVVVTDAQGEPIEEARATAELRNPEGKRVATLPLSHVARGKYESEMYTLPWGVPEGDYTIVVTVDSLIAESKLAIRQSHGERLEAEYGFRLDVPYPYAPWSGMGKMPDFPYDGLVSITGGGYGPLREIDILWWEGKKPLAEEAASLFARMAPLLERSTAKVDGVEKTTFNEHKAYLGVGRWVSGMAEGRTGAVEWLAFYCPQSDRTYIILIATHWGGMTEEFMEELRGMREGFQCHPD